MMSQMIEKVVAAAQRVHFRLGPERELAEYHQDLCAELSRRRLNFECQVSLTQGEKGSLFERSNELEIVVEKKLVLELKTLDRLEHIHDMQVFTYLRLSGLSTGLLLNFHEKFMRKGIRRLENQGGRPRSYRFNTTPGGTLASKVAAKGLLPEPRRKRQPKEAAGRLKFRPRFSANPSQCRI